MKNYFKDKKAQIQIMQTVIIIIVIFIILFIGFIFYMNYAKDSAASDVKKMEGKRAIVAASYVLSIPELTCSQKLDVKQNCFDASKLLVLNTSKSLEYYSDYFYTSKIDIFVFFGNKSRGVCNKVNFPNCNEFNVYSNVPLDISKKNSDFYYIPVSIYNPFSNEYYAAYAKMEVFI